MALINLINGYLSFSDAPLLDHVNLAIEQGERVCLVGRNGAGKSTLLKVLGKDLPLDDGQIIYADNLVVARLEQDPPRDTAGTVFDFVADGLADKAALLQDYHQLSRLVEQQPTEQHLQQLANLGEQLEQQNAWQLDNRIHNVLGQLGLHADSELASLSGGWLRKAALARALVCEPDVLLLDEPTNHLDVTTIEWLENLLKNFRGSIVFISHDRAFIQAMATRIVDLDRGQLSSFAGDYQHYLVAKEEALRVEAQQNALFDKRLAQEEVWIRQGIKARRTRNEGRVRALKALRQQYASRRQVMGNSHIQVEEALRSGKIVFEIENLSYAIGGKTLINNFSAQVLRGEKIALIGGNGCGKTTLIKLLLQQLQPDSGRVHCGTKLEIAYFDQHRAVLDPEKSVMDNLADGKQEITVNGRSRHVLGYLQDFLFAPKRAMTPVKALSGGERNRLLLARLFLKPSNLLILDEPTNDLDVETLELLEERVSDYQGTVLLVSHDRQFVDNAVSQCWFFEGEGKISCYPGGYFDALQQRQNQRLPAESAATTYQTQPKMTVTTKPVTKSVKLSYHEKRELETLPQQIEQLEADIAELQATISHESFFRQSHEQTQPVLDQLAQKEHALQTAFERWEELEIKQ